MILQHLPVLADSNYTSGGDDLIIWVIVEPICCILEMSIRLSINTSVRKRKINLCS